MRHSRNPCNKVKLMNFKLQVNNAVETAPDDELIQNEGANFALGFGKRRKARNSHRGQLSMKIRSTSVVNFHQQIQRKVLLQATTP